MAKMKRRHRSVSLTRPTRRPTHPRDRNAFTTNVSKQEPSARGSTIRPWHRVHAAIGQQPTFLRRSDCLDVLKLPKPPPHQLACCLGMVQGFRPGEIRHARYEDVDVERGVVYVRDSKTRKIWPLKLYVPTMYAFDRCPQPRGLILTHHPRFKRYRGRPVSYNLLETLVHRWARMAGVRNWHTWNPTLLRKFFAKEWHRSRHDDRYLSLVMRHSSMATTTLYLGSIVFVEDIPDAMNHLDRPRPILNGLEDVET